MAKSKSEKEIEKEKEMEALINASKANQGQQLGLGEELERIPNIDIIGNVQSPEQAYDLYYRSLYTILRSSLKDLPKEQRDLIYDQKNIFLTRGKIKNESGRRGADSRQAYLDDMKTALEIVLDWVKDGANPVNLYNAFRDKNIELNYPV